MPIFTPLGSSLAGLAGSHLRSLAQLETEPVLLHIVWASQSVLIQVPLEAVLEMRAPAEWLSAKSVSKSKNAETARPL